MDTSEKLKLNFCHVALADRSCDLYIYENHTGRLAFAATGSWTGWRNEEKDVRYDTDPNTIRINGNCSKTGYCCHGC